MTVMMDGVPKTINNFEQDHVLGNVLSYLSTCNRLEDIVVAEGRASDEVLQQHLVKIKAGKHIRIAAQKGKWILPISSKNQEVEEIYIGFTENDLPFMLTTSESKVQLYSKCMGHLAIKNFSCDIMLRDLMQLTPRENWCKKME